VSVLDVGLLQLPMCTGLEPELSESGRADVALQISEANLYSNSDFIHQHSLLLSPKWDKIKPLNWGEYFDVKTDGQRVRLKRVVNMDPLRCRE